MGRGLSDISLKSFLYADSPTRVSVPRPSQSIIPAPVYVRKAAVVQQSTSSQTASQQSTPAAAGGNAEMKFAIFPFETDRICSYTVGDEVRDAALDAIKRNAGATLAFSLL